VPQYLEIVRKAAERKGRAAAAPVPVSAAPN
jgi:hypothetical protein